MQETASPLIAINNAPNTAVQRLKTSPLNRIFFPNTAWALFLLLPFIAIGFWPGYWSQLTSPQNTTIQHVHTALMMTWVLMGLAQPLLIAKKKVALHRTVGKWSYVLMPLLFITGYLLMDQRYDRNLLRITADVASGKAPFPAAQIPAAVATSMRLGLVDFLLLGSLFILAISKRKNFVAHGTFMLGAILTALGPSAGRAVTALYKVQGWQPGFVSFYSTRLFTLLLFAALAVYQKKKGHSIKPAAITFGLYAIAILVLQFGSKTAAWQWMVEALFK